jgi:predicted metallo-beta-lactamase superfamily hydrolase
METARKLWKLTKSPRKKKNTISLKPTKNMKNSQKKRARTFWTNTREKES